MQRIALLYSGLIHHCLPLQPCSVWAATVQNESFLTLSLFLPDQSHSPFFPHLLMFAPAPVLPPRGSLTSEQRDILFPSVMQCLLFAFHWQKYHSQVLLIRFHLDVPG